MRRRALTGQRGRWRIAPERLLPRDDVRRRSGSGVVVTCRLERSVAGVRLIIIVVVDRLLHRSSFDLACGGRIDGPYAGIGSLRPSWLVLMVCSFNIAQPDCSAGPTFIQPTLGRARRNNDPSLRESRQTGRDARLDAAQPLRQASLRIVEERAKRHRPVRCSASPSCVLRANCATVYIASR